MSAADQRKLHSNKIHLKLFIDIDKISLVLIIFSQTFPFRYRFFFFAVLTFTMMTESSGYFSTARTRMNFHWFGASFVKKITMRMRNANAHTHTRPHERAEKL